MRIYRYILKDGVPVPEPDLIVWAMWMEARPDECIVRQECRGTAQISTAFLGLDHSFSDDAPPLLYETLVFGGPFDGYGRRYVDLVAACRGHEEFVRQVEAGPTREQYLAWAKKRALEKLEGEGIISALTSIVHDLGDHEQLRKERKIFWEAGQMLTEATPDKLREWLEALT